ncbi:PH domain-containing protein [Rathayibacter sp. CAU 1779]
MAATAEKNRAVLRPRSAIWIAIAAWVLCALNLVAQLMIHDWSAALRAIPVVGFIALAAWMLFVTPAVVVERDAVVLKNPARDIRIPWTAITDVQPSYSLQVRTAQRRFRAWAAPGAMQASKFPALEANEQILLHLSLPDDGTFAMSALVDPDQAERSRSDAASAAVRRGWQLAQRQAAQATAAAQKVEVHWHIPPLITLGVLLVASVVTIAV